MKLQNLKINKKLWLLISQIFADLSTGESFLAKLSLGARLITPRLTGLSKYDYTVAENHESETLFQEAFMAPDSKQLQSKDGLAK